MKILGIDTTRKSAKIFVIDSADSGSIDFLNIDKEIKHSEGLFEHIEMMLEKNKLSLSSLDGFACVVGPGSFTGIRVGMSAIKGFNKALNRSVVAMNSFEIVANNVENGIFLLNSTSTSCYYAEFVNSEITDAGVVDKSEIANKYYDKPIFVLAEEQNVINLEYNRLNIIEDVEGLYLSCVMNKLNTMQYGEFLPYYLQLSQAERNLKDEK